MNVHDKCPRCGKQKTKLAKLCQRCNANTELIDCVVCGEQFHRSKSNNKRANMKGVRGSNYKTCSKKCSREHYINRYKYSK